MARARIVLIVALMAIGAAIGYASTLLSPTLYASSATLMVMPQRVPEHYVRANGQNIDAPQLARLKQMILTRTRLERLITDFNLYDAEPMTERMDDAVRMMRERIVMESAGDTVRIGFADPQPKVALQVAERLASLMVEESMRDREVRADNINQFIDSQLDDAARHLNETEAKVNDARRNGRVPQALQIDFEALQARYRALLEMAEEAKMSANMERRQIGERFQIIDAARVSTQPMSRGRHKLGLLGGGIGLLAGLGIAFRRPRPRG